MDTGFGEVLEVTHILGSGSMEKRQGMEFMSGEIKINLRVNGLRTKDMGTEAISSIMGISMSANTIVVSLMALVNINGLTGQPTVETSKME